MFRNPLTDAIVVIVVLLLFFGPKRLPMLSRSIGESVKEFKGGITHSDDEEKQDEKPQLTAAETSTGSAPAGTESPRETSQVSAERDS